MGNKLMTPEAQRIAIAEACGWKNCRTLPPLKDDPLASTCIGTPPICGSPAVPDYLNDLNAMHEAEKVLTSDQCKLYFRTLFDVVKDSLTPMNMVHATATQRAEAFLRTLGLWK